MPPSEDEVKTVTVLGPVPPPVTGMTALTERVVQGLRDAGRVELFNWSPSIPRGGLRFRIARMLRMLRSIAWLVGRGRGRGAPLYTVANSRSGLFLTAVVVWVGRRLGYVVYLHHHIYTYIDSYDWRMAWITRMMDGHGVHVVHSEKMMEDLRGRYPAASEFAFIFPSIVSLELASAKPAAGKPFQLGHLSNLSPAKGIDLVLSTFRALHESGCHVGLKLAGPFLTPSAERMVLEAMAEYGGLVEHVGPVYGDAKSAFYRQLDAFLFPTRNESWGIVLNEALAAGVPAIAYDRGCTSNVVAHGAGLIVDRDADFVQHASQLIRRWIDDADEYREASLAAIRQAAYLNDEGERQLVRFAQRVFGRREA